VTGADSRAIDTMMQLSDRVYVLDDGEKIAEGAPDAVRNNPAVIKAYLGHRDIGQQAKRRQEADT
jgi:branched-chain amino acid transport system ATP-binding protein